MKTIGRTVRKTIGILAFSAMIPVSAWAVDAPAPRGGFQGPPPQAFDACAGKKAGDAVQFTTPRGDNVAAVCREFDGKLAARPERAGRGPGWTGRGPRGGGKEMGMGRGMGALDLTAEQKTRIQAILDEESKKGEQFRKQLREGHALLRETASKTPYDESAVRKMAASQEKIRTELIVSKTGAMNRVMSLLTPAQKEKAARVGVFGCGAGAEGGWERVAGRGRGHGPRGEGFGMGRPDCPLR